MFDPNDPNSKGLSYTAGFFMLIGFAIAGIVLASIISMPVWTAMTGLSIKSLEEGMSDPANSNAAKVILCIQSIFGFFLPAILVASLLNRKPMKLVGFSGNVHWIQFLLIIIMVISALFVSGFLSYVNEHIPITDAMKLKFIRLENEYNDQMEAVIGLKNFGEYLLALVIIGFLPALCEETLFRGGFQNYLVRATRSPIISIIVVSILFSLAHFSYYGFLSRFFLGLVLGLIYHYSGRLWLSIFAHFLNNAIALTVLYYQTLKGKTLHDSMQDRSTMMIGVLALPILIFVFFLFRNVSFGVRRRDESIAHGI